jgi:tRNA A64-2'-O-ribosylphosphate transferase
MGAQAGAGDCQQGCGGGSGASADRQGEPAWDVDLHLPLWVAEQERQQIEAQLDGWVEKLLAVGADVRGLAAVLKKPLRPLWVSQSSLIWTNQVGE